jgi:hypothetical protein
MQTFTYTRPETGQTEQVHGERWRWIAQYADGQVLHQFDAKTGLFHQLREIDQSRLAKFRMINPDTGQFYDIDWNPARKLIHYYMRTRVEAGTPEERRFTSYAFGYETHIAGVSHKVILVILPDDNVVLTEDTNSIQLT